MPRKATETSGNGSGNAWRWSSTADTRKSLLDAASEVFSEHGFADASIAAVVERAGSSVGSLYHHFGGKTELFLALWERNQTEHKHNAAAAVAKAKAAGENNPLTLFTIGARTFLEDAWRWRDLEQLFLDGDSPPGFELVRRTQAREWIRQNGVLLDVGNDPVDRLTVTVLSNIIDAAILEVATSPNPRQARAIIDAALDLIQRVYPGMGA
ncbi:MAG: hypothetical protein QOE94_3119 [Mycobacterium sp.]|jgi:AcrR family transcriptional regulator|nr:hypothetical protein [Mycobacterium sp.]